MAYRRCISCNADGLLDGLLRYGGISTSTTRRCCGSATSALLLERRHARAKHDALKSIANMLKMSLRTLFNGLTIGARHDS